VPQGLLGDKTFREGFAVLGRLGLSFDAIVLARSVTLALFVSSLQALQ
jgi:hypothetical protein